MNLLRLVVGLTAFLLMVLVPSASAATTRHVTNCSSSGPGSFPATFAAATQGDRIVFDLNCTGGSTIVLPDTLEIDGIHITIDGTGHAFAISGNDTTELFAVFPGGLLTLINLVLSDGGRMFGSAIITQGNLEMRGVTMRSSANKAAEGGAILNSGGRLLALQSTFTGNSAPVAGGAISTDQNGLTTIEDSTFTGNSSGRGGAISNAESSQTTVIGSTFTDNTAGGGGALYTESGTLTVSNSTLTENTGNSRGGALWVLGSPGDPAQATLENVTLSDNTVISGPGGRGIQNSDGAVSVANTIVSGGSSPLCSGPVTDHGYNLQFGDTSCAFSDHAVTADPKLGPLADNFGETQTQALGAGSPAIGAGNATVCLSADVSNVDQRGHHRNADIRGNCDIGAYDTGAGPPSGAKTIIDRSPDTITADGSSTATIRVFAFDAKGIPLTIGGATVVLQTTLGSLSAVTDNHDGSYTATLTAGTVSGNARVTGTINGQAITDVAGVDFEPGPPSGGTTLIKSDKQRIPANGTSTATITVQAIDQYGNVIDVGGATVVLSTTLGSLGSVSYIGSGRYQATLTSSKTRGLATIHGTINGQPITSFATVRFRVP